MKALSLPMSFALPFGASPLGALHFRPLLRGALLAGTMAMALAWPETGAAFQKSDSTDLPAGQGTPPKLTPTQATPPGSSVPDVHAPTARQSSAATSRPDTPLPASDKEIGFAADQLNYDSGADVVTASGNVQMLREGNRLRADTVTWNRKTGGVEASGNVSVTDPQGNIAYGDKVQVTDALKDGVVQNLLLVLAEGGRLVAKEGNRINGVYQLSQAAYSPCSVEKSNGCPKQPSWQIKAVRVRYDPVAQRVTYKHARIELFGIPILVLPGFSHPMGEGGGPGFLVPNAQINAINGLEIMLPYYWKIAPNRDLTITPHIFTDVAPMMEGTYRAFVGNGAYRITGFATYSQKRQTNLPTDPSQGDFRGYIDAVGKFQLDPQWNISGSIRRASDRTFLRRYDISRDDRLRSNIRAERIDSDSYLSIAGWAVQTLRLTDSQGQMPVALPVIDYRLRLPSPVLGGRVQFQANSLAIARTDGQDTQRAFVSAMWNLRRLTTWGQELTLTAFGRGDIYHSSNNDLNPIAAYRGASGWQGRGIAALAADVRWPFIGEFLGGTQRITPHLQIVAAPKLRNLSIPNEDARSIDLEDSNLFALNRFPGYDRFEDSTRVTYGLEYALELPRFSIETVVGQSYRLNSRPTLLPDGTGLSDRLSDIVGRTTVRYRDFVSLTHRFRLDKDNLAVRRNEIDATVGTKRTYATVSYLRLDRNATLQQEDLQDREELRLGTRIAFAKFWSVFGSTVIDLTSKKEDPLTLADGFAPVRHRFGVAYQDDCLDIGLTWRRNYRSTGDARNNNTIQLQLAFRNLGI